MFQPQHSVLHFPWDVNNFGHRLTRATKSRFLLLLTATSLPSLIYRCLSHLCSFRCEKPSFSIDIENLLGLLLDGWVKKYESLRNLVCYLTVLKSHFGLFKPISFIFRLG